MAPTGKPGGMCRLGEAAKSRYLLHNEIDGGQGYRTWIVPGRLICRHDELASGTHGSGDDEGWHGGFGWQLRHGLGTMNVDTAGAQGRGGARARNDPCGLFFALLSAGTSGPLWL